MAARECFCRRPVADSFLCETCLNLLDVLLAGMPWLEQQLEVTHSRQSAAATEGGSRGTETPVPWHESASDRRRELEKVLRLHLRALGGQVSDRDTLTAMSARLLDAWPVLTVHDEGGTAWGLLRGLERAVKAARGVIFWKPAARVYLGVCEGRECSCECHGTGYACSDPETCQAPGAEERAEPCLGEVWAKDDQDRGACRDCGRGYSVAVKRKEIEAALDDRRYTAGEIADLSSYLDLGMPRERVRKQVNQWHKRQQLVADGQGRFRFGDVKHMLYALKERTTR